MVRSARAGPSNTQQSQRPTQTQRTRGGRRQAEPVSEEEEPEQLDDVDEDDGDEMEVEVDGNSETTQKVNDLVRLALFMEYKRTPLRRDDINKKVLAPRTRSFNLIFSMAQQKLRDSFGMELVELPSRTELEQENDPATHAQTQTQDGPLATGIKKRATTGSKTYMVRSCLDPLIIEHAAQTLPKILEEEGGDQGTLFPSTLELDEEEEGEEDGDRPPKFYGSLISWSRADQLGSIGILYVILALVLANNRVMSDGDLRRYLKSLRLTSNPAIHVVKFNASSTVRAINLDGYLSNLLKQGYLDRQQVGADANRKGKRGGVGSKRLRTQAEDLEEGRVYEWRWGPRAHCEVGEQNIGRFVAEFMIESAEHEEEAEGDGRRAAPKKRQELLKKMYTGFEKAAGGNLADLK